MWCLSRLYEGFIEYESQGWCLWLYQWLNHPSTQRVVTEISVQPVLLRKKPLTYPLTVRHVISYKIETRDRWSAVTVGGQSTLLIFTEVRNDLQETPRFSGGQLLGTTDRRVLNKESKPYTYVSVFLCSGFLFAIRHV